jgi:hypothetical protein
LNQSKKPSTRNYFTDSGSAFWIDAQAHGVREAQAHIHPAKGGLNAVFPLHMHVWMLRAKHNPLQRWAVDALHCGGTHSGKFDCAWPPKLLSFSLT